MKTPIIIGLISDALRMLSFGFHLQFHEEKAYLDIVKNRNDSRQEQAWFAKSNAKGSYYLLPLWCVESQRKELRRMAFWIKSGKHNSTKHADSIFTLSAINSCCANSFSFLVC